MSTIGLQYPFPIRIPLPVRYEGDVMHPEWITFDGETLRIKFFPKPQVRLRWHAGSTHEHDFLPRIRTPEDVLAHYTRMIGRRTATRERLAAAARFTKCGKGLRTRINQSEATGRNVVGGSDAIYVLSENGEAGAICFWSEFVQKYRLGSFRVGSEGEWSDLLDVGEEPIPFPNPDEAT